MASSPGSASSQGRAEKRPATEPDSAPGACQVLLVGPEAISIRGEVEKILPHAAKDSIAVSESILEAVLMSGGGGRSSDVPLILAGISQEIEQIESAVRSMRKVYPASRIVLLCEPGDEVLCRKAKGWGATDYLILPPDAALLRRVLLPAPAVVPARPQLGASAARPARRNGQPSADAAATVSPAALLQKVVEVPAASPSPSHPPTVQEMQAGEAMTLSPGETLKPVSAPPPPAPDLSLPQLPLMVQSVLFKDLLLGRADFADRLVATLQAYVKWGGALKFLPADPAASGAATADPAAAIQPNPQLRASVALPQQPPLGTLYIDRPANSAAPCAGAAALCQAADWLAALLSLARRNEQLRSLAITDELSGAYNRRYFMKFMSGLLERARQNRFRVTLLLFDIDDFKKYNDTFGHASGDAIIRELIKLLRACTRPHDLVARLGGDEFAAVYWDNEAPRQPNSEHPRDARSATERFRKAVATHQWPAACNIKGEVSISGGLATFPWDADNLETLYNRADEALLRAKTAGKNVFLLHGEDCTKRAPEKET